MLVVLMRVDVIEAVLVTMLAVEVDNVVLLVEPRSGAAELIVVDDAKEDVVA